MDELMVRSRIPRQNSYGTRQNSYGARQNAYGRRKKKQFSKGQRKLSELILKQTFIAVLILLAAVVVKNVSTPVTDFLRNKMHDLTTHHIELKDVYEDVGEFFSSLLGDGPSNADQNGLVENTQTKEEGNPVHENTNSAMETGLELMMPVDGTVCLEYGEMIHPAKKTKTFHNGVDIDAGGDAHVKAVLSGTVIDTGEDAAYGKFLKLQHSGGWITVYAHCSSILVKPGDVVKQGETIAEIAVPGISVGTHLHFEVWKDGRPLNPLEFL